MEHIWAPWRIEYVESERPEGCILCDKPAQDNDVANYILHRGEHNFIMLNGYPYNPGHLMIAPYRHVDTLEALGDEELLEHTRMVNKGLQALRQAFNPQGFNVGVNIGRVAGAGIDDHVHTHIVPRWNGDTSFITVMGDTKVLPQALADSYRRLEGKF